MKPPAQNQVKKVDKSLSANGAMWLAIIIGAVCAFDSGVQNWIFTLDKTLLFVQGVSVLALIAVAVVRDVQVKAESVFMALVAWVLFAEIGIGLQSDRNFTQAKQCQELREHGQPAGAMILETREAFCPRGSDKRPYLSYVKWEVSLPDGKTVVADAIEPGNDYIGASHTADRVRYLPDNPTVVRSDTTISRAPNFSAFDQIRSFSILMMLPILLNGALSFLILRWKLPPKLTEKEQEALEAKHEEHMQEIQERVRQMRGHSRHKRGPVRLLIVVLATGGILVWLAAVNMVNQPHSSTSNAGSPQPSPDAQQHDGGVADQVEVYPSHNAPRSVLPYLKPEWPRLIARWDRDKTGDKTIYRAYASNEDWLGQFDFVNDAAGKESLKQEYFIKYEKGRDSLVVKVYRYVPKHEGDIFDPDLPYNFEKDTTTYTYKVVGPNKYLTYAMRDHEVASTGSDSKLLDLKRDENNHLTRCSTGYDQPDIDLGGSRQMLEDKFLLWSGFGQYD